MWESWDTRVRVVGRKGWRDAREIGREIARAKEIMKERGNKLERDGECETERMREQESERKKRGA